MSFIKKNGKIISFASYIDVTTIDQRIFEQNEGLDDEELIEGYLIRSTDKILSLIKDNPWYKDRFEQGNVPVVNPALITSRTADFTDVVIYYALAYYILPSIADFDTEDKSERNKMSYYVGRFNLLFEELLAAGDWYDFVTAGATDTNDKSGSTRRWRTR